MTEYFNFYGLTIAVSSASPELVEEVKRDFTYFRIPFGEGQVHSPTHPRKQSLITGRGAPLIEPLWLHLRPGVAGAAAQALLAPETEVLDARGRVPALLRGSAYALTARRAAPVEALNRLRSTLPQIGWDGSTL